MHTLRHQLEPKLLVNTTPAAMPSPMWATVRTLLPLAVVVNLVLLVLERSFGSTVSSGLELATGAAISVAAGSVARGRGCRWPQAIWAAWWLGVCGAALNWLESVTGLRPTQALALLPVPPGVSPFIDPADPNSIAMVFNVVIVVVILICALSVLVIAPFALLGYWASGDRRVSLGGPGAGRLAAVLDWLSTLIVAFDAMLYLLFRFGGLDPHASILPPVHEYVDASGQPHADGLGLVVVFIGGLLTFGLLFWPSLAWLGIRLVVLSRRHGQET